MESSRDKKKLAFALEFLNLSGLETRVIGRVIDKYKRKNLPQESKDCRDSDYPACTVFSSKF